MTLRGCRDNGSKKIEIFPGFIQDVQRMSRGHLEGSQKSVVKEFVAKICRKNPSQKFIAKIHRKTSSRKFVAKNSSQ